MKVGKRNIRNGNAFNHLFPTPEGETINIKKSAVLHDTLRLMKKVVKTTLQDTLPLSSMLKANNEMDTLKNVWNFCFSHLQYTKDERGKEQVRRPSRTWKDRKQGVDCDCMSVFIGSILTNLNIPFSFRLTKYQSPDYEHVYPIAHINNNTIILDAVIHEFNREVPYSEKKDINMELEYLNGFDEDDNQEFDQFDEIIDNDYPMDAQFILMDESEDLEGIRDWLKKAKTKVKKVVKKVGAGVKKGLHAINRINPATALLRAGTLASMKLNVMKVASRLRFAYWSDAQAKSKNMDMGKFYQLKRIREKIEKIYFGAGGKPENLKKAILTGRGNRDRQVTLAGLGEINYPVYDEDDLRTILGDELYDDEMSEVESGMNGLGAIATATAIASASGVIATLAALIKKLGSLFKKGTPEAQREVIQDNTENEEEKTRKFSIQNLADQFTDNPMPPARSNTTPVYDNSQDYVDYSKGQDPIPNSSENTENPPSKSPEDDSKKENKVVKWIKENPIATGGIALVVVAGGGYAIYRYNQSKKKKGKSLQGLEGAELGKPRKKRRTRKVTATKKRKQVKRTATKRRKSPTRATRVKKVKLL